VEPIAIVGLGCLFPDAESPQAFWQNLLAGRDSTSLATRAQIGVEPGLLLDPTPGRPDRYTTLRGGFVHGFQLDPAGLNVDAPRLRGLDRVFTWSLHAARAALADSAYLHDRETLRRTGLVLGNSASRRRPRTSCSRPSTCAPSRPAWRHGLAATSAASRRPATEARRRTCSASAARRRSRRRHWVSADRASRSTPRARRRCTHFTSPASGSRAARPT
jgi:acyl transferase domain-containing protein